MLAQSEEFNYQRPDKLLEKYREVFRNAPPQKSGQLINSSGAYTAPYGFLTGLSQLIRLVCDTGARPSLAFAYNSKLYKLNVTGIESVKESRLQDDWRAKGLSQVLRVKFRCINITKKTQTDFELWVPRSGFLKGIPVRILHQPRWWLRLQLDLDLGESRLGDGLSLWQ